MLGAAVFLAACGGDAGPAGPDPDPEPQVATVEVTPGADTLNALGATRSFTAVARDADGDPVPGVSFTWSSSDTGVATVDEAGVVTAAANGTADITAVADGVAGSAALAVIQLAETVTVSPSSATLTTVDVTQQFTATASDANGSRVEGAPFLWSSEDPAVATVDSAGLATSKGPGVSTITASVQGVPGHAALTVSQEIDRLAFRTQPTSATAGGAIDPAVQVEVLDAAGNVVKDAEIAITLSLGTNPGGGTLGGTKTVNATAGVATFSGLWVDVAAAGYGLAAASTGVTGATSAGFDIASGPAARLGFVTQPSSATAGKAINPAVEVQVQDAFGNLVAGSTAAVSVALEHNPGGATLLGTTTVTAVGGVATFGDLVVETAATGYALKASSSGLGNEDSHSFEVKAAAASHLSFLGQPSDAEGQAPITPAVEVAVQDAFGNTVTSSTAVVRVALATDPTAGNATLAGTLTVSAVDGVATFPDLTIDLPDDGFTLEATSKGLSAATSGTFDVDLTFSQLSSRLWHTCGVTVAGYVYCWGYNGYGQLGNETIATVTSTPVAVHVSSLSAGTFVHISAGAYHTCGVTTAAELYCWGRNSSGQLGDGTATNARGPVAVDVSGLSTQTFTRVSAGAAHTCALTTADQVVCWGDNSVGQLGDGTLTNRLTPVAVDVSGLSTPTFTLVSAGTGHNCGVTTAREALCWGWNADAQLGDGTTSDRQKPVAVDVSGLSTQTFAQVSAGVGHTCGVTTADEAFCWGNNTSRQLGDGTTTDRTTPVAVDVDSLSTPTFLEVRTGENHTCGATTAGEPLCWGSNTLGQLGTGTIQNRSRPAAVATPELFVQLTGSSAHTCGITTVREAFCWGYNAYGQLGDASTVDRAEPVRVVQ